MWRGGGAVIARHMVEDQSFGGVLRQKRRSVARCQRVNNKVLYVKNADQD